MFATTNARTMTSDVEDLKRSWVVGLIRLRDLAEYYAWHGMQQRCYNPKAIMYYRYGGRGITICEAWRKSFWVFLADMNCKPDPTYSLDRINNDGNYEPGNCRWASSCQQANNRKRLNRNGDLNPAAKLTWDQIEVIRALAQQDSISQKVIALRFEVSRPTISQIVCNKIWVRKC
jgi:hypothetical protein